MLILEESLLVVSKEAAKIPAAVSCALLPFSFQNQLCLGPKSSKEKWFGVKSGPCQTQQLQWLLLLSLYQVL